MNNKLMEGDVEDSKSVAGCCLIDEYGKYRPKCYNKTAFFKDLDLLFITQRFFKLKYTKVNIVRAQFDPKTHHLFTFNDVSTKKYSREFVNFIKEQTKKIYEG